MAQAVERIYTASRARLYAASLRAVSELGYSITNSDSASGTISFGTGMSMKSWAGQNMTVTIFSAGEHGSKMVVGGKREQKGNPFGGGGGQVFDWGEKGKITRKLIDRVDRVLPGTPEPVSASQAIVPSTADELERLADLKTKGVLTEDEFAAAKTKLLG